MNDTTEPVIAEPAEKMLKRTLVAHLNRVHGIYTGGATKEQLVKLHQALHDGADLLEMGAVTYPADFWYEDLRLRSISGFPAHVHADTATEAPELTPEQEEKVQKLIADEPISDKPLTASERTVLAKLVDNSFAHTVSQVKQIAGNQWEMKKAEIETEWADKTKAARDYITKAQRMVDALNSKFSALQDEAKANGITLKSQYNNRALLDEYQRKFSTDVEGLGVALKKAQEEHQALLKHTLLQIEEQRLLVQARVLRSALTEKTAAFLKTLPTAKEAMLAAQVSRIDNQLEA